MLKHLGASKPSSIIQNVSGQHSNLDNTMTKLVKCWTLPCFQDTAQGHAGKKIKPEVHPRTLGGGSDGALLQELVAMYVDVSELLSAYHGRFARVHIAYDGNPQLCWRHGTRVGPGPHHHIRCRTLCTTMTFDV